MECLAVHETERVVRIMADIEKVIKALECCERDSEHIDDNPCTDCPYYKDLGNVILSRCASMKSDALKLLKELKEDNVRFDRENQKLVEQMAQQPNIVRCKDCKQMQEEAHIFNGKELHGCEWLRISVEPNWFCADGERK